MDSKNLKIQITDLGLACLNDDIDNKRKKSGTPGFIAPEVLKDFEFSFNSDIFSLGCVMYYLITNDYLFGGSTVRKVLLLN